MYNDYMSYETNNISKNSKSKLPIIIVILILIIIGIIIFAIFSNNKNSYSYYEKEMVNSAKEYVQSNGIITTNKIYLDVQKLGFDIKENCSNISGVLIENGNYTAYLSCDDYTSKIIKNSVENMVLKGNSVIFLPKGIEYAEPGYISNKDVRINNMVGTEEGIYDIFYNVISDNAIIDTVTRKVIIIDNDYIKSLYPTIKLNGEIITYVNKGGVYQELGTIAMDNKDGDISDKVIVEGAVNPAIEGEYKILYTITNSSGYVRSVQRKVVVVENYDIITVTDILMPTTLTNMDVTISLQIVGFKYDYTLMPDMTISKEKNITYKVNSNGTYDFKFYDTDGNMTIKTYTINNIDKNGPQGTCTATLYSKRTEIVVNATSSNQISGYQYILDTNQTNYLIDSQYKSEVVSPKNITVNVRDSINNVSNLTCTIVDKTEPQIYVNENGKNCLEGYTCYLQSKFTDSKYCYSSAAGPCRPINESGCGLVSLSTAFTYFNIKDKNGMLYTPYTLLSDVFDKPYVVNGVQIYSKVCYEQCGWSAFHRAAEMVGLSMSATQPLSTKTIDLLRSYLKNGPVILHANSGSYTNGRHFLALLAINDEGLVYLYNPSGDNTTTMDSKHKDDSWIQITDLISGNVDYFGGIAQAGVYPKS